MSLTYIVHSSHLALLSFEMKWCKAVTVQFYEISKERESLILKSLISFHNHYSLKNGMFPLKNTLEGM